MLAVALVLVVLAGEMRRDAESRLALQQLRDKGACRLLVHELCMSGREQRLLGDVRGGDPVQRLGRLAIAARRDAMLRVSSRRVYGSGTSFVACSSRANGLPSQITSGFVGSNSPSGLSLKSHA